MEVGSFLVGEIVRVLISALCTHEEKSEGYGSHSLFSPSVHYMYNADPIFNIDGRYNTFFELQLSDKEVNRTYLTEVIAKHHV